MWLTNGDLSTSLEVTEKRVLQGSRRQAARGDRGKDYLPVKIDQQD